MAIALLQVLYRSSRRVRVLFSERVSGGAFDVAKYSITSKDSKGPDPGVLGALVVPDAADTVELALEHPLAEDAAYELVASAVPAYAGGSATGTLGFRSSGAPRQPSPTVQTDDIDALFYGRDVIWTSDDMAEDPSGDLGRVSGKDNVEPALSRRLESDGLPWAPEYGLRARQAVDGPPGGAAALQAGTVSQLLLDDRVKSASAEWDTTNADDGEMAIDATAELVGGQKVNPTATVHTA